MSTIVESNVAPPSVDRSTSTWIGDRRPTDEYGNA